MGKPFLTKTADRRSASPFRRRTQTRVFLICAATLAFAAGSVPGAAATGAWTTSGNQILTPAGGQFIITGINWYGFETTSEVAHGLYTKDYSFILNEVKQYGYNTIRIPFSNQMWDTDPAPAPNSISACPTCKGKHSRDILALIINDAGSIGLHVILDNHRSEAGNSAEANGLWYNTGKNSNYTEQGWLNDWVSIEDWVHGIKADPGLDGHRQRELQRLRRISHRPGVRSPQRAAHGLHSHGLQLPRRVNLGNGRRDRSEHRS